jgi:hypothetical protein
MHAQRQLAAEDREGGGLQYQGKRLGIWPFLPFLLLARLGRSFKADHLDFVLYSGPRGFDMASASRHATRVQSGIAYRGRTHFSRATDWQAGRARKSYGVNGQ